MGSVVLIGPEFEENLSLRYLMSSLERAGHEVDLVAFNFAEDLSSVMKATLGRSDRPPTLVGLSLAFQWRAEDMMALAMGLREAGYDGHITAGGHFATFAAESLLADFPELDTICLHESEQTLVELLEAVEAGDDLARLAQIDGLALRDRAGKATRTSLRAPPELSMLPLPSRRGQPRTCFGHGIAPLVGSRGCYANCTFCCIAAWHEQTLPGKRYRLREADAVADEMVAMQREHGVDIFVFHDDNFFVPSTKRNIERVNALADALQARGIGPFATVVKARPNDVDPELFTLLRDRLHAIRVYVGIETDADQGLVTLARRIDSAQNRAAIETIRALGMFACFNMLIFDPDTTMASLKTNVDFMASATDFPFNFCRTELYAGTPLLGRLLSEGRAKGDYMFHDYALRDVSVQRVFAMSIEAFSPRNFGPRALHNSIGGWRLQLETVKRFHPETYVEAWSQRLRALQVELGSDTVAGLRTILEHVRTRPSREDAALVADLAPRLRTVEDEIRRRWFALREEMSAAQGGVRDRLEPTVTDATPLQDARTMPYAAEVSHVG